MSAAWRGRGCPIFHPPAAIPPSLGAGWWFSSAKASKHGHPPTVQLWGDVASVPMGFSPSPPNPTGHPRTTAHRDAGEATCGTTHALACRCVCRRGSWCAGDLGMLWKEIILNVLFLLYLIILRPGAGRVWLGGVRDTYGLQHPGGVELSTPWFSQCPMGPCRGVSWGDFGHCSPGSVRSWVSVRFS